MMIRFERESRRHNTASGDGVGNLYVQIALLFQFARDFQYLTQASGALPKSSLKNSA